MNARKKFTQLTLNALIVASTQAFYSEYDKFGIDAQNIFFSSLDEKLKHSKLRTKSKREVSVDYVDRNWPIYSKAIDRIIYQAREAARAVFDEQVQELAQQLLG